MLLPTLFVAYLAAASGESSERPVAQIGQCDPRDGVKPVWTTEARMETRTRVQRACEAAGASPVVCAFADAVVVRESSGRAGVRHVLGEKEDGLGAMGLSLRWHRDKWPGRDEDPAFCQPEVSFAVAHAIMWRAVTRYGARNMLEVQAVYSGQWYCWTQYDAKRDRERRTCRPDPSRRTQKAICGRMRARGFDCRAPIAPSDLGRRIRYGERRSWAEALVKSATRSTASAFL